MSELFENMKRLATPQVFGPLDKGHYVQIGIGLGFYVPEEDFQLAQFRANETGKVQFLAVDREGCALHGTREELLADPNCAGGIAWIVPGNRCDIT